MSLALRRHWPALVLGGLVLVLSTIPIIDIALILGETWQGMPPTFTDENFYYARVQTLVHGRTGGNPHFLEHSEGAPLVVFGGAAINALPQWLGLSLNAALLVNGFVWGLLFAAALYALLRELRTPPWIAVGATLALFIQSFGHIWRAVNLQPVYPFYFLFYLALLRLIREQSRANTWFLGGVTGLLFYLFAFQWQIAVITLGLLVLYALIQRQWPLVRSTLFASLIGGLIGLPVPLYIFWLSHASPYFWESMGRLGLVNTHIPMAEVIYSGGWIGVTLLLPFALLYKNRSLREDREFMTLMAFLAVSGFGFWIMQGSNLITGKLVETGEHVRLLMMPWLGFALVAVSVALWKRRAALPRAARLFAVAWCAVLTLVSARLTYEQFSPFLPSVIDTQFWETEELSAKPLKWLDETEKDPVVVWADPHDYASSNIAVYTKHFTLYTWFGLLELAPEGEMHERYLVSQYFNNPTLEDLKSQTEMGLYLGRADTFHHYKTVERGIKICRIIFFFNPAKECGTIPTAQSLLGDQFFIALENKFKNDIKPNIKAYLAKYHVSYILKDKVLDPKYQPEKLGGKLVYSDERYELYRLPL